MRTPRRLATGSTLALVAILAIAAHLGCAGAPDAVAVTDGDPAPDTVIGSAAGEPVTWADIREAAAGDLRRLKQERYDVIREALDRLAVDRAIARAAAERNMTADELIAAEIDNRIAEPTESEVVAFYEANRNLARGPLEDYRELIPRKLKMNQRELLTREFYAGMRERAALTTTIEPPRFEVAVSDDAPSKGPASAPVTIVEYADYECQYCRQAFTTIERLLVEYGDDVRLVFQDFPIEQHQRAVPSSVATYCAREQGKYWELHDNLMVMNGNLSDADLRRRAETVGLDMAAYDECYASGRHADAIIDMLAEGRAQGVAYTPTFFVNGRMLVGAKSYDDWKRIIDEELGAGAGGG